MILGSIGEARLADLVGHNERSERFILFRKTDFQIEAVLAREVTDSVAHLYAGTSEPYIRGVGMTEHHALADLLGVEKGENTTGLMGDWIRSDCSFVLTGGTYGYLGTFKGNRSASSGGLDLTIDAATYDLLSGWCRRPLSRWQEAIAGQLEVANDLSDPGALRLGPQHRAQRIISSSRIQEFKNPSIVSTGLILESFIRFYA